MIHKIKQLFPFATIQSSPIRDIKQFCFYDDQTMQYIGIPKNSITDREKALLESILTLVENSIANFNVFPIQEKWYSYLFQEGELPQINETRVRFIFFHKDYQIDQNEFIEVIQPLFSEGVSFIWIDEENGVFIENDTSEKMEITDFKSLTEALLSDFYSSVSFYIGRFYDMNDRLRKHFHRELFYFQTAKKFMSKESLTCFEKVFPIVLMTTNKEKLLDILEEEFLEIFQEDYNLLSTIKVFLESKSIISHTAKALYMHRNSLQYRIDKFIEQTSIDIKDFHGALSVYFICLYGQVRISKKQFIT